jgi:hypothetical protein
MIAEGNPRVEPSEIPSAAAFGGIEPKEVGARDCKLPLFKNLVLSLFFLGDDHPFDTLLLGRGRS